MYSMQVSYYFFTPVLRFNYVSMPVSTYTPHQQLRHTQLSCHTICLHGNALYILIVYVIQR